MRKRIFDVLRKLLYKNYHSAKIYRAYRRFLLHCSSKGKPTLVIYQMGKVGSVTVLRSLRALELDISIYHTHGLARDNVDRLEEVYRQNFFRIGDVPEHLLHSHYLRKQIDRGIRGKKWKMVTLVRDPIARNISAFFQTLDVQLDYDYQNKIKSMGIEGVVEDLIRLFLEQFPQHEVPLTWLDTDLKRVFGINLFSSAFPKLKGYRIYEGEHADVLLLRLESLNECACDAFREFLNVEEFTLLEANIGSEKEYGGVYRQFLSTIIVPDSYIEKMYTSQYARHFYTEEEINMFKAKWRKEYVS